MKKLTEKEFIKRVENLGLIVDSSDEHDFYITQEYSDRTLAEVSKNNKFQMNTDYIDFWKLNDWIQYRLFQVLTEFACTDIEDREDQVKYIYKSEVTITNAGEYYIARRNSAFDEKNHTLCFDSSGEEYARLSKNFHFTDKDVEEYSKEKKYKAMFDMCEKIEVKTK